MEAGTNVRIRQFRLGLYLLTAGTFVAVLCMGRAEFLENENYEETIHRLNLHTPSEAPSISDESIRAAMKMFQIHVPANVAFPKLDSQLEDRGITSKGLFSNYYKVYVGPSAFESWALLGSTLAHEIEIHCQQSFLLISLLDQFGFDGTGAAERPAYMHEIHNAERFGLSSSDIYLIHNTVESYYPPNEVIAQKSSLRNRVGTWLAASLSPNELSGATSPIQEIAQRAKLREKNSINF